jgi:hypothetical protein
MEARNLGGGGEGRDMGRQRARRMKGDVTTRNNIRASTW